MAAPNEVSAIEQAVEALVNVVKDAVLGVYRTARNAVVAAVTEVISHL